MKLAALTDRRTSCVDLKHSEGSPPPTTTCRMPTGGRGCATQEASGFPDSEKKGQERKRELKRAVGGLRPARGSLPLSAAVSLSLRRPGGDADGWHEQISNHNTHTVSSWCGYSCTFWHRDVKQKISQTESPPLFGPLVCLQPRGPSASTTLLLNYSQQ